MGIKAGLGIEPTAVAESIYKIASRGQCVPMRLPLGATAWKLAREKFSKLLEELDVVKELSGMGQEIK